MSRIKRFLDFLDLVEATARHWLCKAENLILFPIAYPLSRWGYFSTHYHELPLCLRASLIRFGLGRAWDVNIAHEAIRRQRARVDFNNLQYKDPPKRGNIN